MARQWPAHQFDWGFRLRTVMAEKGVSRLKLAERSGVSNQYIGLILVGKSQGTPAIHAALADALGEDPGWVFPRTERELIRAEVYRIGTQPLARPRRGRGMRVLHGYDGGEYAEETRAL